MPFRFLEDVAIADAAFEAWGQTVEEVFCESARALMEIVVDTKTIDKKESREIRLQREDLEGLLYAFLSEIIFLKDTEDMLFGDFAVKIRKDGVFTLKSLIYGEKIDRNKHAPRCDIKAVTYYLFSVRKKEGGWKATVVIDI